MKEVMRNFRAWKQIVTLLLVWVVLFMMSSCSDDGGKEEEAVQVVPPTLNPASGITQESFSLSWNKVSGADNYLVEVATDEAFDNLVSSYDPWTAYGVLLDVDGLTLNTPYFARMRTVVGEEISAYSNVVMATTLDEEGPEPETALKEVATTFSVGMAVQTSRLTGDYLTILTKEFDQITAEWEMKMSVMYPSSAGYDFTRADELVEFAETNGLEIHGHSLIWHNSTPAWVEDFAGTDAEFEAMVKDYIITTVTRYKGKIKSWDVVNEAFEDGSGNLRNSVFRQKMGDDYIEKCYKWTREADPDVLIFYNDYNMTTDASKLGSTIDMAEDFIARDVPIDGIGFQMHISYNGPDRATIESAAKKVTDTGLMLHFSELDIRANPNNDMSELTVQRAVDLQEKYKEVVEIYNAIPEESKFALTVWGLRDQDTWLIDFWGHQDWPLMYNNDFSVKKAHTGFLEGLE
ncbi:endo-1,4-beta-xylanase [Reichenbachiella sp. MSK19-1]|uniref:endo-1,4-beta-xylanase n=1 Tax=Reichenbachiella sp. MSK19-1 TaxID=1897631 RepID=UPI000E6B6256|nr:endo-1,4-beta-xylanase [Reichenbachiella sp. MSK19-1]